MLMNLEGLASKYGMTSRVFGVLHIGAHLAEEAPEYARVFPSVPVCWVEANPAVLDKVRDAIMIYPGQRLVPGLVYEQDGIALDFHVTNYDGMSSSILQFGTHPQFSPDTVFVDTIKIQTTSIDTLVADYVISANMLVMDIQGAELFALRGGQKFLDSVDYIMTEVNKDYVYVGCGLVDQLDSFLNGFERTETYWVGDQGWGDALYVRKALR